MSTKEKDFKDFIKEKVEPQNPLGEGGGKIVYPHPHKADRVWGVYKKGAITSFEGKGKEEIVKAGFYMIKILHLLFPKNIPDVWMVTSRPESIVRQRVNVGHIGDIDNPEDVQAIQNFDEILNKLGIRIDDYAFNHALDGDDNVTYFDDIYVWAYNGDRLYDLGKLKSAIEDRLAGEEKFRALNYLERIESLHEAWLKLQDR